MPELSYGVAIPCPSMTTKRSVRQQIARSNIALLAEQGWLVVVFVSSPGRHGPPHTHSFSRHGEIGVMQSEYSEVRSELEYLCDHAGDLAADCKTLFHDLIVARDGKTWGPDDFSEISTMAPLGAGESWEQYELWPGACMAGRFWGVHQASRNYVPIFMGLLERVSFVFRKLAQLVDGGGIVPNEARFQTLTNPEGAQPLDSRFGVMELLHRWSQRFPSPVLLGDIQKLKLHEEVSPRLFYPEGHNDESAILCHVLYADVFSALAGFLETLLDNQASIQLGTWDDIPQLWLPPENEHEMASAAWVWSELGYFADQLSYYADLCRDGKIIGREMSLARTSALIDVLRRLIRRQFPQPDAGTTSVAPNLLLDCEFATQLVREFEQYRSILLDSPDCFGARLAKWVSGLLEMVKKRTEELPADAISKWLNTGDSLAQEAKEQIVQISMWPSVSLDTDEIHWLGRTVSSGQSQDSPLLLDLLVQAKGSARQVSGHC